MARRQGRHLFQVASHENGVGHRPVSVGKGYPTLLPDGQNGTDQVLVVAHAAGDAMHDYANTTTRHCSFCLL